jgi:hypothetical protein
MLPVHRSRETPGQPRGVWRAVVTRATGGVWVEIPRLNPGRSYGPCDIVEGLWTPARVTGNTATTPAHTHDVGADLAVGDRVVVGFLEGRPDDVVVLGRLV